MIAGRRETNPNHPQVKSLAPYVGGQGLMVHEGQVLPVILTE